MIIRDDIFELREVIDAARVILRTTALPYGRLHEARELLEKAISMTDDLMLRPPLSAMSPKRKVRR